MFLFFQQFEAQNVFILFLTTIYSFIIENRLQTSLPVFMYDQFLVQKACVHARHDIVLHLQFRNTRKILCILQQMTVHVVVTVGVYLY